MHTVLWIDSHAMAVERYDLLQYETSPIVRQNRYTRTPTPFETTELRDVYMYTVAKWSA